MIKPSNHLSDNTWLLEDKYIHFFIQNTQGPFYWRHSVKTNEMREIKNVKGLPPSQAEK